MRRDKLRGGRGESESMKSGGFENLVENSGTFFKVLFAQICMVCDVLPRPVARTLRKEVAAFCTRKR